MLVSNVDEDITFTTPEALVLELADRKSSAVYDTFVSNSKEILSDTVFVIGADTVVALDSDVMGKPKDEEDAYRMLRTLSGNTHRVITGVCIIRADVERNITKHKFYETTYVDVYPMSDEEISAYIATKDPMDKAGSYGIQGIFGRFVRRIRGEYDNVVGLPAARLYHELLNAGWTTEE